MTIRASHTLISAYLVSGTPPSALSSHTILAALQPEGTDGRVQPDETLFAKLGAQRGAQDQGERNE
jgi:hypothetical protein